MARAMPSDSGDDETHDPRKHHRINGGHPRKSSTRGLSPNESGGGGDPSRCGRASRTSRRGGDEALRVHQYMERHRQQPFLTGLGVTHLLSTFLSETVLSSPPDNPRMDDQICPLVSDRNRLIGHCLCDECSAWRTAELLPDGGNVSPSSARGHPPVDGGRWSETPPRISARSGGLHTGTVFRTRWIRSRSLCEPSEWSSFHQSTVLQEGCISSEWLRGMSLSSHSTG